MAGGGLMAGHYAEFPEGLKVGDFIQLTSHFSDVFFEVARVIAPCDGEDRPFWMIDYVSYEKYAKHPRLVWTNCAGSKVRAVIKAEMAVPVLLQKRLRFHSHDGQFDPFYGFAPRGQALREREAA